MESRYPSPGTAREKAGPIGCHQPWCWNTRAPPDHEPSFVLVASPRDMPSRRLAGKDHFPSLGPPAGPGWHIPSVPFWPGKTPPRFESRRSPLDRSFSKGNLALAEWKGVSMTGTFLGYPHPLTGRST